MDIAGWEVFGGLIVIVALYWLGVTVLGVPASLPGLVLVVVFSAIGLIIGRVFAERME